MPFRDIAISTLQTIASPALLNQFRDNDRYLKGKDGAVVIEDNVTIEGDLTVTGTTPINMLAPGTVFDYPSTVIPDGYLECNGLTASRMTYAALFAVIGTTYGTPGPHMLATTRGSLHRLISLGINPSRESLGSFESQTAGQTLTDVRGMAVVGDTVYYIDRTGDDIWSAPVARPTIVTRIDSLPPGLTDARCATEHAGGLYAIDYSNRSLWLLDTVAPSTGSSNMGTAPSGMQQPSSLFSLGGNLYGTDNNGDELWLMNIGNPPGSTRQGSFPSGLVQPFATATVDGVAYGLDRDDGQLWRLDASPGSSVLLATFTVDGWQAAAGVAGTPDAFMLPYFTPRDASSSVIIKT